MERCSSLSAHARVTSSAPARRRRARVAAAVGAGTSAAATATAAVSRKKLASTMERIKRLPPSEKAGAAQEATLEISSALDECKAAEGGVWDSYPDLRNENVFAGQLKQMGIKDPAAIGVPSVRNDAAFLGTVVATSSVLAVLASTLPGDIGFFSSYLIGGVSIAVLAIGSTAPGLLQFFIGKFSNVFPDYRERVARHEAAHFLVGYCCGVPVAGYSLDIENTHTDFVEAKLQRKVFQGKVSESDLNTLAVVACAGIAGEALQFEEVVGQNGDLRDLQLLMNRSETKLTDQQQQRITRWSVWMAASILKTHAASYAALQAAMQRGAPVDECFRVIEEARTADA